MKINNFYFLLLLIGFFSNSFSQVSLKNKLTNDFIKNKINYSAKLIEKGDIKSYQKGFTLLDSLETAVEKNEDVSLLLTFYYEKAVLLYENYEYDNSLKYADKSIKILEKHNDKRVLGLNYELIGVVKNIQGKLKERDAAVLKAASLLSKYGKPEDNIDINYNLAFIYNKYKDWDKTIYYSKQAIHFMQLSKTNQKEIGFLGLFIAEGYLALNDLVHAKKYIDIVEKEEYTLPDRPFFMASFYKIKGDYFMKMKDFKNATKFYTISTDFHEELAFLRITEINESLMLKQELQLKGIENNRIIKEMELHKQNDTYKNFILILSVIITSILIFLAFFQSKNSSFKTKTNQLLEINNIQLVQKNIEIENALSVKNKFLNTVAHELRTPLNAISSILYLLKEKYNETEKENLTILEHSSDYLINLSNNIIEYIVLSDNKTVTLKPTENNLKKLVSNIIASFKKDISNNNEIYFEFDEKIDEKLLFDKSRVTQVLNNLIDNANKFTENGKIIIKVILLDSDLKAKIQNIRFQIDDEGIGIDDTIKDKIGELFFQGSDEISVKYGGSGIGLSLVKKTLDLLQSKLQIESKSVGTTIYFDLKLKVVETTNIVKNTIKKDVSCNKKNILVVEDNKINQILVEKILLSKGFNVTIAENGLVAVEKAIQNDYCLVLMDIMMPIMDGFQASEEIAKIKPDLPIVVLTAVSEELNKEKFEKVKIKKVLNKPINIEDLTNIVNFYCEV